MSGVRMLHFLKDWWKFVQIHQSYTMALNLYISVGIDSNNIPNYISEWQQGSDHGISCENNSLLSGKANQAICTMS